MSKEIGSLKKERLTNVWPKEEADFTPWLKDHGLSLLLEKIGVDEIKEVQREVHCGDGSKSEADLVVTYPDGEEKKTIVIENQYGKCDADHLGRLLMYSASLKASVVVWVTEEERPEYVTTINWLNENSNGASFYLVKITLYQIGNSLPAPMFDVLAGPKEDEREDKIEKDKERTESMELCYGFWRSCLTDSKLIDDLASANMHQRKANTDRWKDYSIGSNDVWLCASVTTKEGWVKTAITCKNGSVAYEKMKAAEFLSKLEQRVGMKPSGGKSGTKTYSTINFYRDIDIAAGADQQAAARRWFGEMLPKLKAFLKEVGIIR